MQNELFFINTKDRIIDDLNYFHSGFIVNFVFTIPYIVLRYSK